MKPGDVVETTLKFIGTPRLIEGVVMRVLPPEQYEHSVLITFPGYAECERPSDGVRRSFRGGCDYWLWVRPDALHVLGGAG